MFKYLSIGVLALLLAACGAPKVRHAVPPPKPEETIPRPRLPGRVYRIDENQSELRILVYRAGPLARFGHNHVIVNHGIRGSVNLADVPGDSVFWLTVPVAGFVVDDAEARRQEGGDFAGDVPDDAKSGTMHNMRSAALLNADAFPSIAVRSVAGSGDRAASGAGASTATVAISVAGHESTLDVPLTLDADSRRLSATGSLELRQSALGLTPYSLMLGALQVQDAMTIKFNIVAVPD